MEEIKRYLRSEAGRELREWLLVKLYETRDITNVKEYETTATQALELKAQKRTYNKLKTIFSEILDLSEEEKSKDPRDSYVTE